MPKQTTQIIALSVQSGASEPVAEGDGMGVFSSFISHRLAGVSGVMRLAFCLIKRLDCFYEAVLVGDVALISIVGFGYHGGTLAGRFDHAQFQTPNPALHANCRPHDNSDYSSVRKFLGGCERWYLSAAHR